MEASPLATTRKIKKSRNWLPFIGVIMIIAGVIFFAATSGVTAAKFLLGLWPLFALIAGVAAVMGFAVERKPRSPVGGMLLLFVGALFSVARFDSGLNPIQIYGRYWILLLAIFAAVELVRYYTHRESEGKPPKLFGVGRLFVIALIVGSGVVSNRASLNGDLLSSSRMPGFLNGVLDSLIGEKYSFEDKALPIADLKPGSHLVIHNPYGDVKIRGDAATTGVVLTKGVRAWNEDKAKEVAEKLKVTLEQTSPGVFTLTTNRDEVKGTSNRQFNTDLQIDVPAAVNISITSSYSNIVAKKVANLAVTSKYGQLVEVSDVTGNATFTLTSTDVTAANVSGDVTVTGGKAVRLSKIAGDVDISARHGQIDLSEISGEVKVDAPHSHITAKDLAKAAVLKTQHSEVSVTRAAAVTIEAQHSNITATNINGDLTIETSNRDVMLKDVSGKLVVNGARTDVSANDIQGKAIITTSHGRVDVKNFHSGLQVETSFKDVSFTSVGEVAGDVTIENKHGDIKAVISQGTNFKVDAESENGRVKVSGFSDSPTNNRESFISAGRPGAPLIKLRTTHNTITVAALEIGEAGQSDLGRGPKVPPLPPTPPRDPQAGLEGKR